MGNEPADTDNDAPREPSTPMRLFIFKSEPRPDLRAFGADLVGSQLPKQFAPWRAIGAVAPTGALPHKLSRDLIEAAVKTQGFQLWRMKQKDETR